jgi:hypothetical protein
MKRSLAIGALAVALLFTSWGAWSELTGGGADPFRGRVLVLCLLAGAGLAGAAVALRDPTLAVVPLRLQVAAVLGVLVGTVLLTNWRHLGGQDLGDVLLVGTVVGLCWRVPASVVQPARRPLLRRMRRLRGPHLRVVS